MEEIMKKLLTAVLFLTVVLSLVAYGQKTTWAFEKAFPDTGFLTSGVHGLAVSGAGLLWVQDYYIRAGDSIFQASTSTNRATRAIYVYNTNGNVVPVAKIQIMSGTGIQDTMYNAGLGLRTGPDGDVYLSTVGTVYRVNGTTGAAKTKAIPFPGASTIAVGVDNLNEIFVGSVVPGNPIKIYDATTSPAMTSLGNAADTAYDYGRSVNVSADGNDVYNTRYSGKSFRLHSDNGSLGPYVIADTLLTGMAIESSCWNPRDGLIYLSSGGQTPSVGYTNLAYFAYDPVTKTIKDSILWNQTLSPGDARPRALAFSVTGDTAWIGQFGSSQKYSIQMFRRVPVSVERIESGIPSGYTLSQNYPNPFNPTTEIQFSITKAAFTTLKVYDMLGKEVASLVSENLNPGTFKSTLDGSKLSSGTYLYRLVSGSTAITKKMMLLK
jgi:hypothetical protein